MVYPSSETEIVQFRLLPKLKDVSWLAYKKGGGDEWVHPEVVVDTNIHLQKLPYYRVRFQEHKHGTSGFCVRTGRDGTCDDCDSEELSTAKRFVNELVKATGSIEQACKKAASFRNNFEERSWKELVDALKSNCVAEVEYQTDRIMRLGELAENPFG